MLYITSVKIVPKTDFESNRYCNIQHFKVKVKLLFII